MGEKIIRNVYRSKDCVIDEVQHKDRIVVFSLTDKETDRSNDSYSLYDVIGESQLPEDVKNRIWGELDLKPRFL